MVGSPISGVGGQWPTIGSTARPLRLRRHVVSARPIDVISRSGIAAGNACSAARAISGLSVEPIAIGRFQSARSPSDSPRSAGAPVFGSRSSRSRIRVVSAAASTGAYADAPRPGTTSPCASTSPVSPRITTYAARVGAIGRPIVATGSSTMRSLTARSASASSGWSATRHSTTPSSGLGAHTRSRAIAGGASVPHIAALGSNGAAVAAAAAVAVVGSRTASAAWTQPSSPSE